MTTKPLALTALALMLATTLATPSTDAFTYGECIDSINLAQRTASPRLDLDNDLVESCAPELCPAGSIGAEGTCVKPGVIKACDGEGRSLLEQCGIAAQRCPDGKTGTVVKGKNVCVDPDTLVLSLAPCPDGEHGFVVAGSHACFGTESCTQGQGIVVEEKAACAQTGSCPAGKAGIVVNGQAACANTSPELPVDPPSVPPPACKDWDDEHGMGGTNVACDYDCRNGDTLGIYVESEDHQFGNAKVDGYTHCGGATAYCDIDYAEVICAGVSEAPASSREVQQECKGWSRETFDSPVWVACYTIGVSTACDLIPQLCQYQVVGSPAAALASYCVDVNPGLELYRDQLEASFGHLPDVPMSSFTLLSIGPGTGFVAKVGPANEAGATCLAGPI